MAALELGVAFVDGIKWHQVVVLLVCSALGWDTTIYFWVVSIWQRRCLATLVPLDKATGVLVATVVP